MILCIIPKIITGRKDFASFFKQPDSFRSRGINIRNTNRRIDLFKISKGEPYAFYGGENVEYYNFEIVSAGFLREQIRRMMAVLVHIACGNVDRERFLNYFLQDPDPRKVPYSRLKVAPPGGLFLADVVYDSRMFNNPEPYYQFIVKDDSTSQAIEECFYLE